MSVSLPMMLHGPLQAPGNTVVAAVWTVAAIGAMTAWVIRAAGLRRLGLETLWRHSPAYVAPYWFSGHFRAQAAAALAEHPRVRRLYFVTLWLEPLVVALVAPGLIRWATG